MTGRSCYITIILTPSPSASPLTNIPTLYASCWRNKMKKKINNQILYSSFWSIIYGMNSLRIKFFSQEQWSSFSSLFIVISIPEYFFPGRSNICMWADFARSDNQLWVSWQNADADNQNMSHSVRIGRKN